MSQETSYAQVILAIHAIVRIEGSQKKAAESFGVSPQYLTDVLHGRREISDRILSKLGLRKRVIYERIQIPKGAADE